MLVSHWITTKHKIQPIGLDIGGRSVKMVQVAMDDDRVRVLAARKAPVDPAQAEEDSAREKNVVDAIRQLLAEGAFRGKNVVSALPIDKLRITSLRLPEAEVPQADKLLRREAIERFGLDPRNDIINYVLAGSVRQGDDLKNEYILFAADGDTIRSHIRILETVGLTPVGIDAPPCALFRVLERTMRRQEDREKTAIFIDVGHRFTTVVFGRGGELCFVKQIPIGIGRFNEEVASALGMTVPDAELLRFKLQQDEPVDASMRRHVVDALNVTAEQLAAEVSLCLRYYTVTFRGKRVERTVVAGGGAYEQVLLDVLRRHLSVDVEVAEPLRGFELHQDRIEKDHESQSADLALAVGLTLKGCRDLTSAEINSSAASETVLEGESI